MACSECIACLGGEGRYDATTASRPIEAENFFELRGPGLKLDLMDPAIGDDDAAATGIEAGFGVGGLTLGSELHYPNIRLPAQQQHQAQKRQGRHGDDEFKLTLTLQMAAATAPVPAADYAVVGRVGAGNGREIGRLVLSNSTSTGSWSRYRPFELELAVGQEDLDESRKLDLVLCVEAASDGGGVETSIELLRLKHFNIIKG